MKMLKDENVFGCPLFDQVAKFCLFVVLFYLKKKCTVCIQFIESNAPAAP